VKIKLSDKQKNEIESLKNTFPNPVLLSLSDMARLSKPKLFPKTNDPRLSNEIINNADRFFAELNFVLDHFTQFYRYKLLTSPNFTKFVYSTLNLDPIAPPVLEQKSQELLLAHAVQLFNYSLNAILFAIPPELMKSLLNSAKPFVELLNGISKYTLKNSMSKISDILIPDILLGKKAKIF